MSEQYLFDEEWERRMNEPGEDDEVTPDEDEDLLDEEDEEATDADDDEEDTEETLAL